MAVLLEEKLEAETRAAVAEKLLSDARGSASRAEAQVSALEAEVAVVMSEHTTVTMRDAREQGVATGKVFKVRW